MFVLSRSAVLHEQQANMGYAGRMTRLGGQIIDWVVAWVFAVAGFFLAQVTDVSLLKTAGFVAAVGYYFFCDGMSGGSYGKKTLGMKVVDEVTGQPASYMQSLGRNFLLSILGPIDWIFIFGEKHQRLGDKAAGTVVLNR
jgi:uncharacterized RDD family membrane protein YckC